MTLYGVKCLLETLEKVGCMPGGAEVHIPVPYFSSCLCDTEAHT